MPLSNDFLTLKDALGFARAKGATSSRELQLALVCGFAPLYLPDLVAAYLRRKDASLSVNWRVGSYGGFRGNLAKALSSGDTSLVVAVEWSDLDPRLSLRNGSRLRVAQLEEISREAASAIQDIARVISTSGAGSRLVGVLPSLPLPPFDHVGAHQNAEWKAALRRAVAGAASELLRAGVRLVDPEFLDNHSPPSARHDLEAELAFGFPFSRSYASVMASALAALLAPATAKKGLIVDLDNTLWKGILGEDGIEGVHWLLEDGAQHHGAFQRFLGLLHDAGVLLAIVSKNEPALVDAALARGDLLVDPSFFSPVMAGWEPKSTYVAEVLRRWNVGADAVVFVDDSPFELAEVTKAQPGVVGVQFPGRPGEIGACLRQLRELFAKPALSPDDALRARSIESGQAFAQSLAATGDPAAFLRSLQGTISITGLPPSNAARSLELINKTNQFNLNGIRLSEPEWQALCTRQSTFVERVTYEDRLGQLGTVAALYGQHGHGALVVEGFVLSCRAFSRRIEHHLVASLFNRTAGDTILFRFATTSRNHLTGEFLEAIGAIPDDSGWRLDRATFFRGFEEFHRVELLKEER